MLSITKVANKTLLSNTYIIFPNNIKSVWVLDPGDNLSLLDYVLKSNRELKGVLVTHSHFDHICGINNLTFEFPKVDIYASEEALKGLRSSKINMSIYTDFPFKIKGGNLIPVYNNSSILLDDELLATVILTPGHSNDCVSFHIDNYLFTGDSLIPGIKVHTKSKGANTELANLSINQIFKNYCPETIVCPGHGDIKPLKEIIITDCLTKH